MNNTTAIENQSSQNSLIYESPNVQDPNTSEFSKELLIKAIMYLAKRLENYDEVKKAINQGRSMWKDNLIKYEKDLVDIMKEMKDPEIKKMISDGLVKYSDKLIEIAEQDLNAKKSNNPFMNLINTFIRKFDLDGKKSFWIGTLDKQKDLLKEVLKAGVDRDTEYKVCKTLINYCDLLIAGFDREMKDKVLNNGSNKSNENGFTFTSTDYNNKLNEIKDLKKEVVLQEIFMTL